MKRRIIITGAAGFIGTNTAIHFLEKGYHVIGVYHNKQPSIFHREFEPIKADLRDKTQCMKIINNAEDLIMTASFSGGAAIIQNSPMRFAIDNTVINMYSMEAAYKNNIKNIVFISSGVVYPDISEHFTEDMGMIDDPPEKYFFHGWNRRYSEIIGRMYSEKLDDKINFTALRIDNIYGPFDDFSEEKSHVMAALIRRAVRRENPFVIWGDGSDYKDFMYVSDVAEAVECALNNMNGFQVYNIASGNNYTINDVLDIILKCCDYEGANIDYDTSKPAMPKRRIMNIEKARQVIGFNPKITIEEGILRTVKWYKENEFPR